jgi:multiple sugar transport system permease protein
MTEQNYTEKELTVEQTDEETVETPVLSEDVAGESEEVVEQDNFFVRFIKYAAKNFDSWKGWVYLLPALLLLLVFTVWPIINTVRIAFLEGYRSIEVANENLNVVYNVGFGNFAKVFDFKGFKTCLKNTVLLCVITVPLSTALALLIAVCLNAIKPLQRFLQTIFFLPYVTNSIAIGMVFTAMFNITGTLTSENPVIQTAGIMNNILEFFGFEAVNWINAGSTYWANMTVLIIYIVWNALPFKILILLGGLQSVNKQYYEAAQIDSTPRWRVFLKITVPLLSPMLAYVIITGFIGGFKEYSSIIGIFGDTMGPVGDPYRLNTMVGFIYRYLPNSREGLVSAAAIILFLIIFAVTMVNLYVSKKKTHY